MEKRSDEQFLKEEGMTKKTAKRIYNNLIPNVLDPCCTRSYPVEIVMAYFTFRTKHNGMTSAIQFLYDIDESTNTIKYNTCDIEHCNYIECCCREGCSAYQEALEMEEGEDD